MMILIDRKKKKVLTFVSQTRTYCKEGEIVQNTYMCVLLVYC